MIQREAEDDNMGVFMAQTLVREQRQLCEYKWRSENRELCG
jgi:hypothetical protein